MPIAAVVGLSFSDVAWTYKFPQTNTHRQIYGMQDHLPVHLIGQYVVVQNCKGDLHNSTVIKQGYLGSLTLFNCPNQPTL